MSSLKKNKYNIRIIKHYTSYNNIEYCKDCNTNNNYRIIKSNINNNDIYNVDKNINKIIHPITLEVISTNNKPLCLTKFNYINNKIESYNYYKCSSNINNYNNNLFMPYISISYTDLLKMYDIDNIESLYNWININMNKNYDTILRIINSWILINKDNLKLYINYLSKIIYLSYYIKYISNIDDIKYKNKLFEILDNINISNILNTYLNNNNNINYYYFIKEILKLIDIEIKKNI